MNQNSRLISPCAMYCARPRALLLCASTGASTALVAAPFFHMLLTVHLINMTRAAVVVWVASPTNDTHRRVASPLFVIYLSHLGTLGLFSSGLAPHHHEAQHPPNFACSIIKVGSLLCVGVLCDCALSGLTLTTHAHACYLGYFSLVALGWLTGLRSPSCCGSRVPLPLLFSLACRSGG